MENREINLSNTVKKKIGIAIFLICLGFVIKIVFFPPDFLYAGTIEATKVDLSARLISVIASTEIKEGDHVNKDTLLMALACEDYRLAYQIATQNFTRAASLFKQGSQSEESYDQIKNRKDDADLKLSWCKIVSPVSGIVLNIYHEAGEMVAVGTKLITVANLRDDIYANIYVPQTLASQLKIGQKVVGYLPELEMKEMEGTIAKIGEEAEFTPKNVQTREERTRLVFAVKVAFSNQDELLKPGMTIEIKLEEK